MVSTLTIPRQVQIGDAAAFVGTTPRAIRHYHDIGLLPEPERGSDNRRLYGYSEVMRLLWIRKMAEAGIALDDIRDAFADVEGDEDVAGILDRLEQSLDTKQAELERQRTAVRRMRARGNRMGLLSDLVATRLETLPEGSVRPADLDNLLVVERVFGALGAALNATRYIALANDPDLKAESDRVDAAEEALDDTVAVDDPRVARIAAERHAFDQKLNAAIDGSALADDDEAVVAQWDALYPDGEADAESTAGPRSKRVGEVIGMMPYDFSPARLRCMQLALELGLDD